LLPGTTASWFDGVRKLHMRPQIRDTVLSAHPEVHVITVSSAQDRSICYGAFLQFRSKDVEPSDEGILFAARNMAAGMGGCSCWGSAGFRRIRSRKPSRRYWRAAVPLLAAPRSSTNLPGCRKVRDAHRQGTRAGGRIVLGVPPKPSTGRGYGERFCKVSGRIA
jgi:hypothetical protein